MTFSDRERLLGRIRQIRGYVAARERSSSDPGDSPDVQPDRLQSLEARVAHLEHQLDGLQDSVHRESERHARLIAELQAQVEPGAMGASLAEDARDRGL